jgi:hypothetical protein
MTGGTDLSAFHTRLASFPFGRFAALNYLKELLKAKLAQQGHLGCENELLLVS